MDDMLEYPSTIIVMADDIHTYAWSGTGDCLGHSGLRMIAESFFHYPVLSELVDLEYEFWAWVVTRPAERSVSPARWQQFHIQGLILTRRLAVLLRGFKVQVFYCSVQAGLTHQQFNIGPL